MKDYEVVHKINGRLFEVICELCNVHNFEKDYALRLLLEALQDDSVIEAIWSKVMMLRSQAIADR